MFAESSSLRMFLLRLFEEVEERSGPSVRLAL
jgi:hypothetical protein